MGRKSIEKPRNSNAEKRTKWIRQLFPFFKSRGLAGFNMDDVSDFLMISKATIYNHYSSKDEIIDFYLSEKCRDFDKFNELISNQTYSIPDRYQKSLYHLLKHMCDLNPVVREDLKSYYPEKWDAFMVLLDDHLNRLKKLYQTGIDQGIFNPVNPKLLSVCDRNMLLFLSDSENLSKCGLTMRSAFDEFMYMRRSGLINQTQAVA